MNKAFDERSLMNKERRGERCGGRGVGHTGKGMGGKGGVLEKVCGRWDESGGKGKREEEERW
jgi:hypothetical protein